MTDAGEKEKEVPESKLAEEMRAFLEVTRNHLLAYLTLLPAENPPKVTQEQLKLYLQAKGIKFGVREEGIAGLVANPKFDERILIAEGVPPVEGEAGGIRYFFSSGEKIKVTAGEKIGEILPSKPGEPGTDVHGEAIECTEHGEVSLPQLFNIEPSGDDGRVLISKIDGYLSIEDTAVKVEPFFVVDKLVEEYEAYVKVAERINESDFKSGDLLKFIKGNGIVYGILEQEAEEIFRRGNYGCSVLIAKGERGRETEDGRIEYHFELKPHLSVSQDGSVDYKELNVIQNVKKGDKLAEVIPPVKGTEGCTIFGNKVLPREGKVPALPQGDNTCIDSANPSFLLAEIDGSVLLKGELVMVDPVFAVKSDIDYSTGNVNFNGSVNIGGDLKGGFKVKAAGDVQIEGVVEDAEIEAGGKVLIKMGFIGRGAGRIQAKGDVSTRYCVGQTIVSDGDIYISDYVMNSQIQAGKSFYAVEKNGLIIGGEICALEGIEANVAGNENYAPTSLVVGTDKSSIDSLRLKRAEISRSEVQIRDINNLILKLNRRKLVKKNLPDKLKQLPKTLLEVRAQRKEAITRLTAEIEQLEKGLDKFREATVKIHKEVFPGTRVTICDRGMKVADGLKAVLFKYSEGVVVALSLDEAEQPAPKPEPEAETGPEKA
ncbi:MAG TPA: FapA family protein [Candidatus Glassbacteria bacterium]|nr:FapA family protein [Candidatus Glassbacteria bacterium]